MERLPRAQYTKEFREEAVKLVREQKLSTCEAARRLQLPPNTLDNWLQKHKAGKLGEVGQSYRPLTEAEMELTRLRRENAELKMERDFLKKAAAYFAKESRPGTR
jgi:transposase-like protein